MPCTVTDFPQQKMLTLPSAAATSVPSNCPCLVSPGFPYSVLHHVDSSLETSDQVYVQGGIRRLVGWSSFFASGSLQRPFRRQAL